MTQIDAPEQAVWRDRMAAASNLDEVLRQASMRATQDGALQPIETTLHHVEQDAVRFVVRMLGGAAGREAARRRLQQATVDRSAGANPFLPYDPALFVAELSPTHLCLLNKFPVVAHHLLIVTRTFEPQEARLTTADFDALLRCMQAIDGLAFYNSGNISGASQRHKHLQLAPFPLDPAGVDVPIAAALGSPLRHGEIVRSPHLPFPHALLWLPDFGAARPGDWVAAYQALLTAIGVWRAAGTTPAPYNWLATRGWMLAVPRCAEAVEGMSVNGLGFAGSLLVRDQAQLNWLNCTGPLRALQAVCECAAAPATDEAP